MKSDRPLVTVPTAVRWSLLLLACLLAGLPYAASLEFDMIFQTKCIFEEVYEVDEKVTGTFNAFHKDNPKQPVELSLRIDSPSGQMVYEKRDSSSAAFSVPRLQEGEYKLCFTAKGTCVHIVQRLFNNIYFIFMFIYLTLQPFHTRFHLQTIARRRILGSTSDGTMASMPQTGNLLPKKRIWIVYTLNYFGWNMPFI